MAVDTVTMGKKIRNIRKEKSMRQKDFAKRLDISQQTLSRYENGQAVVPYEVLVNIVEQFDVSIEYVLELESQGITPEEQRIVDYFRNINDALKPHIRGMLQKIMEEFPKDIWALNTTGDNNREQS